MPTRRLERTEWRSYFDRVSRSLRATKVEVRVEGLDLGDQVEVSKLPLRGLSYDPHDDLFEVSTDRVRHLIDDPREIYVQEEADGLHSVEVLDADDHKQIIVLTPVLRLPPP